MLKCGRIQIQQREGLANEHLACRELPAAKPIPRRQEVEVTIALLDELAPEAPIKALKVGLRVDEILIGSAIITANVPPAPQHQVNVGKVIVGNHRFKGVEGRVRHVESPGAMNQSSISNRSSTGDQGRSRGLRTCA